MPNREKIISFVRGTLGCECPDSVFEHIECIQGFRLTSGVTLLYRLDIGRRLLVYVLDAPEAAFVEQNLARAFKTGIAERNTKGFNRLRLVVVTDDTEVESEAERVFNLIDKDGKVHLHVVSGVGL